MGFEEYLNSNLGRFKDELSQKEIKELKGLYDKLYIMKNKANMAPVKPAPSLLLLLPKHPQKTQFCSSLRPRPQSYQVLPGCSVHSPADRPQLAQCLPR